MFIILINDILPLRLDFVKRQIDDCDSWKGINHLKKVKAGIYIAPQAGESRSDMDHRVSLANNTISACNSVSISQAAPPCIYA